MTEKEVLAIFEQDKDAYLTDCTESSTPVAFLLGGQGAVGKGRLVARIQENNPRINNLLNINGDLYRNEHPDYKKLSESPETYSANTQIFSNIFTEGFINEAIKRRLNVSVEGTMRNSDTPLNTAALFRKSGFGVEVYAIAAPEEFSSLALYTRYANEIQKGKIGRLAEKSSHDAAVIGMPHSLDLLYNEKAVDAIYVYNCFAKQKLSEYHLLNGQWDKAVSPSTVIAASRDSQRQDQTLIQDILERSRIIEETIDNPNILDEAQKARRALEKLLNQ